VPIGVVGEILIGGPGVARGYLNRPDLTRERFIPDLLGAEPGGHLYRTGDLGRWLPDGTIEFLGRNDNQVKIRGFRIELGEIEVRLAACAGVREAVVIARQRTASGKQLIAYLTAQPGHALSPAVLRLELSRILPDYMIPSAFITVLAFPLTPNGKLDRRALPSPPDVVSVEAPPYAPPQGTLETTLAEIWCALFEIRRVGRNDHFFFDLGGNSLLAVRLATQISRRLGANLPLAMLFQAPSVAALATLLTDELAAATGRLRSADRTGWSPLVEITPENGTVPLFCLHGAGGNVLIFAELARILGPHQPIFGLQARGTDGKQPAFESFDSMVEVHLSEIRRACPDGPYYLVGYSGGGVVAFEIAQRLKAEGKAVALLAMLDTGCPTVFGRWVPLRVRLARSRSKRELASAFDDLMPHKVIERQYRKLCYRLAHWITARGSTVPFHLRNAYLAFSFERIYAHYQPQRFDGRVLLFHSASAKSAWSTDPDLGWAPFAADGVEVVKVGGGHEDMMRAPHIQQVANRLRKALPLVRHAAGTGHVISVPAEEQSA
jgi:thioesterase domain-containing protein/acyl carrier protein